MVKGVLICPDLHPVADSRVYKSKVRTKLTVSSEWTSARQHTRMGKERFLGDRFQQSNKYAELKRSQRQLTFIDNINKQLQLLKM